MSEHRATVSWRRRSEDFSYDAYNRDHEWNLGEGVRVPASAAPEFLGHADRADPERAYVAALSSCHMLTFLALASRKRFVVDAYTDEAVGFMEKNDAGRIAITRVVLRPTIVFSGREPTEAELEALHERAHQHCFIANSVRTEVTVERP